jgi:hypothetical protein
MKPPARLWSEVSLDQRQRLHSVLFPSGVTYLPVKDLEPPKPACLSGGWRRSRPENQERRPRRDLNQAESLKTKDFFRPDVSEMGPIRGSFNTGVQTRGGVRPGDDDGPDSLVIRHSL